MDKEQVGRFGFADRATDERSPCGSPPSGSVSTSAFAALSARTGCDENLVYEIGKSVADRSTYKSASDNHTRVWLAAQAGARLAFRHRSEAVEELVEALSRYVSCCGNTAAMVDRESVQEAWRLARAALAKHRGEQG